MTRSSPKVKTRWVNLVLELRNTQHNVLAAVAVDIPDPKSERLTVQGLFVLTSRCRIITDLVELFFHVLPTAVLVHRQSL